MQDDILNCTYNLIDVLKSDPRYKRLLELNSLIEEECKDLLADFNYNKEKYEDALKYGNYHPSLSDYEKKLSEAKASLYNNELVKEYNKLYREFQNELDEIAKEIKISVIGTSGGKHGCKK